MKGLTNAAVLQGNSSSLIYASNPNYEQWGIGDKGFITNRLRQQTYSSSNFGGYQWFGIFPYKSSLSLVAPRQGNCAFYTYNGSAFTGGNVPFSNVYTNNLLNIEGDWWTYNSSSNCRMDTHPYGFPTDGSYINSEATFYIGDGLALRRETNNNDLKLVQCDYDTKKLSTVLYTFNNMQTGYAPIGIKFGNRLLLCPQDLSKNTFLYDITTLTTPTQLFSGMVNTYIRFATGLESGDILFCNNSGDSGNTELKTWTLYKIDDDNNIVAIDAPENLQTLLLYCTLNYNPTNKILSIGTHTDVYFFVFDEASKTFSPLKIELENLPENYHSDEGYRAILSNDLNLCTVTYSRTSTYGGIYAAVLENTDGELCVYKSINGTGESFVTGFATGNIIDSKVELETVLPKIKLTVNVTPTPDTFEIIGAAQ